MKNSDDPNIVMKIRENRAAIEAFLYHEREHRGLVRQRKRRTPLVISPPPTHRRSICDTQWLDYASIHDSFDDLMDTDEESPNDTPLDGENPTQTPANVYLDNKNLPELWDSLPPRPKGRPSMAAKAQHNAVIKTYWEDLGYVVPEKNTP